MTKKPSKDVYQLKERSKIESEVFDRNTLILLSKLIKKGVLKAVDYPVSTGKEANLFRAIGPNDEYVALKVYKNETSPFFRKKEYIQGDPRFERIKFRGKDIIVAFARKEFKNLEIAFAAGVPVPKPHYNLQNVVVMEFLGEEGLPYPTLVTVGPPEPERNLQSILDSIKKMYRAGLVHTDLSEYNILSGKEMYLIDFGQGVILAHPSADKFLERDVSVILKYFSRYGVVRDLEKTLIWIKEND